MKGSASDRAKVLCHDGDDGASIDETRAAVYALRALCPDGDPGFYDLLVKVGQLHSDKSAAYDNEDNYQMIKAVAARHGMTPVQLVLIYMDKHFEALLRLIRDGNEGNIEDAASRFMDLTNYSLIGIRILNG